MTTKGWLVPVAFLLIGILVGAGGASIFTQGRLSDLRAEFSQLQQELDQLKASLRAVIQLLPGEGDNAPPESVWKGQTGRIRWARVSTKGFDYIVEMEGMPPERTYYVFFAIAPVGENPLANTKKYGQVTTDIFGRATLAGVVPLPPATYNWGNFISDVDDPNPPYTHRTYICTLEAASFEVVALQ